MDDAYKHKLDEIMRQDPLQVGESFFNLLCFSNKPPRGPIASDDFRQIIDIEYEKLSDKSNTVAKDEVAARDRKHNIAILSAERNDSQRVALTTLLRTKFKDNVKIEDKIMTLSKNCGLGGNLFCCNPLSKFTNNFVITVITFFGKNNGKKYDGHDVLLTLSDLFDEIRIKSNFFELRCLTPQQKQSLRDIIGSNIRIIEEAQVAGSHSRRKRFASKKSSKSHRHHRRSARNKKRNTKRHIKRHTKRYRHRK